MTYRPTLSYGVTDNLAKTNWFGSTQFKYPHCKKSAGVPEIGLNGYLNSACTHIWSEQHRECVEPNGKGCVPQ